MAAVNWVSLTKVVVRDSAFKLTVEPTINPVPFTVRLNVGPPTVALSGESVPIVGTGLFTVNDTGFDVPPPGVVLVTVMLNVPAVAISAAGISAFNCVGLTNVVGRAVPSKSTTEPETNPVPDTVSVIPGPPGVAFSGEIVAMVGAGLFTVNVTELEVPPGSGLVTVTAKLPLLAISASGMDAVSCVELVNVVVRAVPLNLTVEPLTKFVPLIVSVNVDPPASAFAGEIVVMVGASSDDDRLRIPVLPVSCRSIGQSFEAS